MSDDLLPPERADTPPETPAADVDKATLYRVAEALHAEQNLINGLAGGVVAMLAGAGAWGVLTVMTGYNYSLVAIGIGLLVGFGVQFGGKGLTAVYSIIAAVLSVFGCLFGNLFAGVIFESQYSGAGILEILSLLTLDDIILYYTETLQFMDLIFWLVAVAAAWQTAQRRLTEEQAIAVHTHANRPVQDSLIS